MIRWDGPIRQSPEQGSSSAYNPADWTFVGWQRVQSVPICPDLLRLDQIGEADGLRGRVVRAFFRVLDALMPVRP